MDTNRAIIGVLATMLGTDSTDELLKWRLDRKKIVLVGQCDTNPVAGAHGASQIQTPYVIFWHPGYQPSQSPTPIAHPFLDLLFASHPSTDFYATNHYVDRVASRPTGKRFSGRWLAGFARVPDTRFAVIYQTQDRVSNALAVGTLLALLGVLSLVVGSRLSRRHWASASNR
jgi:hypothetical protein